MQHYREEVHLKLREAVVQGGVSLRTLAAHTELGIDELRLYLNEKRATDTCIGRLHSYFYANRQEKLRHLKSIAKQEDRATRYSQMMAIWRELREVWNVKLPNPFYFQDRDIDYRRAAFSYYDFIAKSCLLQHVGRGRKGVWLPDSENYWQWKIRLNRAARPGDTMKAWLASLPSSV